MKDNWGLNEKSSRLIQTWKSIKIEDPKTIKKSIKTCFGITMFQMKLLYTAQWMKDEWTMNDEDWNRS
jgi:hypothetical protein